MCNKNAKWNLKKLNDNEEEMWLKEREKKNEWNFHLTYI